MAPGSRWRRLVGLASFGAAVLCTAPGVRADLPATVAAVKPSIVVVGLYKSTASPRFNLRGTGFAVADGSFVITNAHVLPTPEQQDPEASVAVQVRARTGELQLRKVTVAEIDRLHDLALLRMEGAPLPALKLRDSDTVREGESVAFTGFPIGGVLGFSPVTHRATVSSVTPIALPAATGQQLSERAIRSLRDGTFNIFQLDGTAYPGNSGGPLFDPETGEVVGVINMVFVKSTKEAVLSQPSGISYAIPANFIAQLLQRNKPN